MSRKVSKIDEHGHPGHGFYQVEGMNGHYTKETAERVAAQMSTEDEERPHTQRHNAPASANVGKDGSVACPSCGHRFKAAQPAAKPEGEESEKDDSQQS